jgi:group I intron endonuclease
MTAFPETSGIYKITCTVTGKFYIGSTANLRKRLYEHFRTLRHNIHSNPKLQYAFNKYGEECFVAEALELVLTPFLLDREQYWLDKLKPAFNIASYTQAAHRGLKHSPESIAKMSANRRGKPAYNRGQKPSPEAIEKNRQAHLGKPGPMVGKKHSPATIEKFKGNQNALGRELSFESRAQMSKKRMGNKVLIAIAPDGTEYIVHVIREFAREHNLKSSSLSRVARGDRKHHRGWAARYVDRN